MHLGWLVEYWYVIFCIGVIAMSAQFSQAVYLNGKHNDSTISGGTNCSGSITYCQGTSEKCKINCLRCFWYSQQTLTAHHWFAWCPPPLRIITSFFIFTLYQLDNFVQNLKQKLDTTQKEAAAWKAKYNIKTQEEMDASSRQ